MSEPLEPNTGAAMESSTAREPTPPANDRTESLQAQCDLLTAQLQAARAVFNQEREDRQTQLQRVMRLQYCVSMFFHAVVEGTFPTKEQPDALASQVAADVLQLALSLQGRNDGPGKTE